MVGKPVHIEFDGGRLTSAAGMSLLAAIEQRLGIVAEDSALRPHRGRGGKDRPLQRFPMRASSTRVIAPRRGRDPRWPQPLHRCQSPNLPKTIYEKVYSACKQVENLINAHQWSNGDAGADQLLGVGFSPGK